jgi:hypothetical protein
MDLVSNVNKSLVGLRKSQRHQARAAKKPRVENGNGESGSSVALDAFPDGLSLLSMTHIVESHHNNFPREFVYGQPFEGFHDDFWMEGSSEYCYSDEHSW